jgi:hypothetical protein
MPGTGPSAGFRAAIALAIVVGGYLVFEFGRLQAGYNIADEIADKAALGEVIAGLEDQIAGLKQEIALLETHREVEKEAYKVVEANLADLEQKIQEQSEAIAFYRGIVSPKDGGRGLRVQDIKLTPGRDDRHYTLRLVLVQVMKHDRAVKGNVAFSLEGSQDGAAKTYALEALIPEDASSSWPFQFRYFQEFDRELVLPEGFTPERINVEVNSKTKSIASIERNFDWLARTS